ncbi:MAG: peptidoglycan DD-metalloendopeptidase family protein [Firmicutes bacterium]|nr:peptidoglycan DD-metalloendopeptidase family protein [Bacillota bacterium]
MKKKTANKKFTVFSLFIVSTIIIACLFSLVIFAESSNSDNDIPDFANKFSEITQYETDGSTIVFIDEKSVSEVKGCNHSDAYLELNGVYNTEHPHYAYGKCTICNLWKFSIIYKLPITTNMSGCTATTGHYNKYYRHNDSDLTAIIPDATETVNFCNNTSMSFTAPSIPCHTFTHSLVTDVNGTAVTSSSTTRTVYITSENSNSKWGHVRFQYNDASHTWGTTTYSSTHPHEGTHTCSLCGTTESTGTTQMQSGCTQCYPTISNGYYKIYNSYSGKYLTVNGGYNGTGTSVTMSASSSLIDQYWRASSSSSGCMFYPLLSGYGSGSALTSSLTIGGGALWTLESAENGLFYIKNGTSYLTASSSGVSLSSYTGTSAQVWSFSAQSTFTKTIHVQSTGGSAISGATIEISANNLPERRQTYGQTTDSSGNITLTLLSGYEYGINASASGYVRGAASNSFTGSSGTCIVSLSAINSALNSNFTTPLTTSVSSRYGWRCFWTNYSSGDLNFGFHKGTDYPGSSGQNFYTVCSGEVQTIGFDNQSGYYVTVLNIATNWTVTYKHLLENGRPSKNTAVTKGTLGECGLMGNTGSSTGTHLHVEIFDTARYLDPQYIY